MGQPKAERAREILAEKCRRISSLWVAYYNSGKSSDVFGREFYHAVGDVLNGTPLSKLELFHIDPKKIADILSAPPPKSGIKLIKKRRH